MVKHSLCQRSLGSSVFFALMVLCSCGSWTRSSIYFPNPSPYLPDLGQQTLLEVPSENRIAKGLYVQGGEELVVIIHGNGYSLVAEEALARKLQNYGYSLLFSGVSRLWCELGL
jgi:hypothetical protein